LASTRGAVQEPYSTTGNIRQTGNTKKHFPGAKN